IVGTTNKSMAAMSGAWLCKKVRHPWLGGPRRLTMYLATLDCATSNPSFEQFAVNAWRTPKRIFDAHPPDQRAQLRFDLRSPSLWARLPKPGPADRCRAAPRCQNVNANNYSKGGSEEVVGRDYRARTRSQQPRQIL